MKLRMTKNELLNEYLKRHKKYSTISNVNPFLMENEDYKFGLLNLKNNGDTINISFEDLLSVDIPQKKFLSMLNNKEGRVTIGNYKVELPKKLQRESHVEINIYDKKSKELLCSSSEVWSPHHNTNDWEQLINFVEGSSSFAAITYSYNYGVNGVIGITIGVVKNTNLLNDYPLETKIFSYNTTLNEEELESNKIMLNEMIEILKLYNDTTGKKIIIQDRNEVEKLLEFTFDDDLVYNFDNYFSKKDLIEISKKDYISQDMKFYDDQPYSSNSRLIKMYIDKEINLNKNSVVSICEKAIIDLKSNKSIEIFPFNDTVDTKYEKGIKVLNKSFVVEKNEKKLIQLINSKQVNFKWGSETNMLPIEHILYFAIKNNLKDLVIEIIKNTKAERGDDFRLDLTEDLKFLKLALDTNNSELVDFTLGIYQGESVQKIIKKDISYLNKLEFKEKIDELENCSDELKDKLNNLLF